MKARRIAILGPSECGKSFLTSGFTRGLWRLGHSGIKWQSVVFDPWKGRKKHLWTTPTDWGAGAWVDRDFERWKRAVVGTEGKAVVWDEGTGNGGRDNDNKALFTEIRHNHPFLFFLGHRFDAMLPVMRTCLTDLIMAKCDVIDVEPWARAFADRDIMQATKLDQYQFLWKRAFQPVRIVRFTPQEIAAGLTLGE